MQNYGAYNKKQIKRLSLNKLSKFYLNFYKNKLYVITIAHVNNNINKTLKFTYVGSVKRMTINKFS